MGVRKRKNQTDAAAQLEAARIIADNPSKYPGALQEWAQMVLYREYLRLTAR